jgi:type IV pilus assembly protein PilC
MAKRMGLSACADYCRRFGTAFRAGIDIVSLCQAEAKHGHSYQQQVMSRVAAGVADGNPLAESMANADPKYFPRLLVSMVRLGEQTGRLERTLLQLAEHYQHRLSVRRLFLMGIAWPTIQLVAAIMVIGLLIWILGILKPAGGGEMMDITGLGLRGNSGVVIYFSFVALFFGLVGLFVMALKNNWFNLHAAIPLFYLIPKIGPAIQTITLARFCWTLSMSLDAGLDPMRAIDLAMDSTDSDYYRSEAKTAKAAIQKGKNLGESLAATQVFPSEFLNALEVAELSGTDAESLSNLARNYDERAKMAVKTIAGIATAVIWLLVVVVLVFMILRMAMNVFGVYDEFLP